MQLKPKGQKERDRETGTETETETETDRQTERESSCVEAMCSRCSRFSSSRCIHLEHIASTQELSLYLSLEELNLEV
jgi:hypothetical protein